MAFKKKTTNSKTSLAVENIRAYLIKTGWKCDYDWQGKIEYYVNDKHPLKELKLTVDKNIKDFDTRLETFLDLLAEVENKHKINLVEDILDRTMTPEEDEKAPEMSEDVAQPKETEGGRLKNGQFVKGHKFGNMPKSINGMSLCAYRGQLAEHVPEAIAFVKGVMDGTHVGMAVAEKQMRLQAAKMIIEYVLAPPKATTYIDVEINTDNLKTLAGVKEESAKLMKQTEGSHVSLESISMALEVLQTHVKFIEMADIEPRMREIELQLSKARGQQ